jgi:hypothetical protein
VAIVDINNTITIEKTFQTGPTITVLAQELGVEGVEHEITLDGHRVRLFTTPTVIVYQLILNDPIYGELDALNVLG